MLQLRRRFLISIHAPTRGATYTLLTPFFIVSNFNPRSHEGSDSSVGHSRSVPRISIHAPTRGATIYGATLVSVVGISIHAPTRGATDVGMASPSVNTDFNPRSHEGSDLRGWIRTLSQYRNFNPRSHEGSDSVLEDLVLARYNFNPRSHEGSDSNFI